MSFNQFKSNFRQGEPKDHFQAKAFIAQVLGDVGYTVHTEYPLVDSLAQQGYKHDYDVVAFGRLMVVEIDDPSLHAKPHKIRNDKRAEGYIHEKFPNAKFFRLDKHEINNLNKQERDEYLFKNFLNDIT